MRISILAVFFLGVSVPSASDRPHPDVYVVEPESEILTFIDLPLDERSPSQRIVLHNAGSLAVPLQVSVPVPFQIAASGGDLGTGGEMWFDITCTPYRTETEAETFVLYWCDALCDYYGYVSLWMTCAGNLVSFPTWNSLPPIEQYQTAEMSYEVSNPRSEPIAIDAVSVAPPFTAALESGPLSLDPGESTNVHVTFQPDGRRRVLGRVDVLSGGRVAGRFDVEGLVNQQITPFRWDIQAMPLGAEYTVPIAIRNASLLTRTITGVSFSAPGVQLSGAVGAVMAPGEVVRPLLTIDADALGRIDSEMTVAFDAELGESIWIWVGVRDADFFAEMDDETPADGRLDFGAVLVGSGPVEKRIRVHNLSANPRQMQSCPQGDTVFQISGDCPMTIAPGGIAELIVTFTPPWEVLDYVRTLDIQLFPDLTMTVALSARVVDETPVPDPGDDGGDDGSGDDGTGDDGTEDDGSGDDGAGDDGAADGSTDDGPGDDGPGDDSPGDDGSGDDGSGDDSSGDGGGGNGGSKGGGGGCSAAGGDHVGLAAALALLGLAVVRGRARRARRRR